MINSLLTGLGLLALLYTVMQCTFMGISAVPYNFYSFIYWFSKDKRVYSVYYTIGDYMESHYKNIYFDSPTTTAREIIDKMGFNEKTHYVAYNYHDGTGTLHKRMEDDELDEQLLLRDMISISCPSRK